MIADANRKECVLYIKVLQDIWFQVLCVRTLDTPSLQEEKARLMENQQLFLDHERMRSQNKQSPSPPNCGDKYIQGNTAETCSSGTEIAVSING